MIEDIYRQLAQRLDALPNGFPATQSGAELRLLRKLFTPMEARLATVMKLRAEPANEIAARAGVDATEAYQCLKEMVRKGLIRFRRGDGELRFALMPFVVGFFEEQVGKMDEELARLVEDYFQEIRGLGLLDITPQLHRIIPVEESIPIEVEIYPYERASELLGAAKSFAVRRCICRVQKRLIGQPCHFPEEVCLLFAPVEGAFDHDPNSRVITREEAFAILRQAEEAGLIHSSANRQDGIYYMCNCCTCCCGLMRGIAEFGIANAVARSDFYAVVDENLCIGCGNCVERCQFKALSLPDEVCVVDLTRCMGCGVCASACSEGALSLRRRPVGEQVIPPRDGREWDAERAKTRGIRLEEVL